MTDPHLERPRSDRAWRAPRYLLHPLRPLARWVIRRRYDVRLHRAELVPPSGGVIFASNHVGVIDGPLLAIFAPRPVHALTKVEMFRHWFLGPFLRQAGQIPLDRFHTDPAAVKSCLRMLRDGGTIGIYPEGSRGAGDLERFHRGAAYLALVSGAVVVPVTMLGSREPGGTSGSLPHAGCDRRHGLRRALRHRRHAVAPHPGTSGEALVVAPRAHAGPAGPGARVDRAGAAWTAARH